MSENNIYASPVSDPQMADDPNSSDHLATRLSRLGASILDSLILMVVIIPVMLMSGYIDMITSGQQPSLLFQLGLGILGVVIFLVINFKLLLRDGQSLGKKVAKIKVVRMDNSKLDSGTIFKRFGFYYILGNIPVVGGLLSLINILFIFAKDQRCLHDKLGDTKVIKCG